VVVPSSASFSPTARPRPAADVSTYALDDDLVLYDARTTAAHVLNSTAAHIWRLCDGSRDLSALASQLAAAFALEPSQARADVADLVTSLHAAGLLTLV
jgi:PqqD family protein of HPr-rel-A system